MQMLPDPIVYTNTDMYDLHLLILFYDFYQLKICNFQQQNNTKHFVK